MPYSTIIRLSSVARNPANGFPARLLDGLPARRADSLCIFPGAGPGLSRPLSPWPDCEPSHPQPDGAIRNRPTASKLASARSASASCCVRSHYHAIPSLHRPLSRPGAATENPLRCHIGPNGAQAFSLVGSLIPICPAFTPPIGGFGLTSNGICRTTSGRPPALDSEKTQAVRDFLEGGRSVSAAARTFNVSRATIRAVRDWTCTRRTGEANVDRR